MKKKYTCEKCGGKFVSGWSDEEANEEAKQFSEEEMFMGGAIVCDDCYQEFMGWLGTKNRKQIIKEVMKPND